MAWLPEKLSAKPKIVWEKSLAEKTLGGIAATRAYVIFSDRELNDTSDSFHCVEAQTGKAVWSHTYPALGSLDYGKSPRATPLIHGDLVFLFGAFGHLHCIEMKTGKVLWDMDVRDEFNVEDERKWGMCSSPLMVDDHLIINPGGKQASLVALEPRTGKVIWKTPGRAASYGNFIVCNFSGKRQLVGHDLDTLGGWDIATGKRLWEIVPPLPGDFNVPTPIQVGDRLLVSTENNRTRLYRFETNGVIDPQPIAVNKRLNPDTHTPVVIGDRVFGIRRRLFCLDLKADLKVLWEHDSSAFNGYASIIASDDRLLIVAQSGEVLLLNARANKYEELGRWDLFQQEQAGYAHPAVVGTRLFLRSNSSLVCVEMKE